MNEKQLEKRLTWLDEKNREAAEKITEISELLNDALTVNKKQAKQISDMNDEISRLAGIAARIHDVDDTLKQHRKEVTRQLEEAEQRRTEKEANIEALRKSDLSAQAQRLDQIQGDLTKLEEIETSLASRKDEEIRIGKQIGRLEKRMDKLADLTNNQVDQVKSLARTNEKLNKEMQKTTAEAEVLRKKSEETRGSLEVLADGNRSLEVRIGDLSSAEAERSSGQARWIERQELAIVEFENSWKRWERRFDGIEQQAASFDERLASYEEMHRALKTMRTELGELMERLERRITEVSEMQRLSDNRMKHDWSSFQSEDLKRWNTHKLTIDEQWKEHTRLHEQLNQASQTFSDELEHATQHIQQMMDADRLRLSELISTMREWLSEVASRED